MQPKTLLVRIAILLWFLSIGFMVDSKTRAAETERVETERVSASKVQEALFSPDHLVHIEIKVAPDQWKELCSQSRDFLASLRADSLPESPFTYVKADITVDGLLIENVGIRKKGFLGSLDKDRPSLKIRFNKYVDQLPFGNLERLTLNNNKQDDSRLSQYLSYRLFNEVGIVSPRCNYAKVTVNGEPLGIYSNVESVKPAMLERGFGDGKGLLAEGTVTDLLPTMTQRFEYKKKHDSPTKIDKLAAVLAKPGLDLEAVESLIDVEMFIRYWATESLIGFWDGYTHNQNNFFIYDNPTDSKLHFLPWGTDSAFTYSVPPIIDRIKHPLFHSNSVLANRLYHHPPTRALYLATMQKLLAEQWNEAELLGEIDRVESMLKEEVLSERRFSRGVTRVRNFVKDRRRVMDSQIEDWPIRIDVGPRVPGLVSRYGTLSGSFAMQWNRKSPSSPETQGQADVSMTLEGKEVVFKQVGVTTKLDDHYDDGKRDGIRTPTILFTGVRKSDNKTFTVVAKVRPEQFHPSSESVPVTGVLIEGSIISFFTMLAINPGAIKLVNGTVQLEKASMNEGAPIAGEADLQIVGFTAKKQPKVPWVAD